MKDILWMKIPWISSKQSFRACALALWPPPVSLIKHKTLRGCWPLGVIFKVPSCETPCSLFPSCSLLTTSSFRSWSLYVVKWISTWSNCSNTNKSDIVCNIWKQTLDYYYHHYYYYYYYYYYIPHLVSDMQMFSGSDSSNVRIALCYYPIERLRQHSGQINKRKYLVFLLVACQSCCRSLSQTWRQLLKALYVLLERWVRVRGYSKSSSHVWCFQQATWDEYPDSEQYMLAHPQT